MDWRSAAECPFGIGPLATNDKGMQNRLTGVSINRFSVKQFFGSKKFRTVTEPKISVKRFSVN